MVISEVFFACKIHTLYSALLKICYVGVSNVFHNTDVTIFDVTKRDARSWRVISQHV